MKLTRQSLRKLIIEAILNESDLTPQRQEPVLNIFNEFFGLLNGIRAEKDAKAEHGLRSFYKIMQDKDLMIDTKEVDQLFEAMMDLPDSYASTENPPRYSINRDSLNTIQKMAKLAVALKKAGFKYKPLYNFKQHKTPSAGTNITQTIRGIKSKDKKYLTIPPLDR